MTALLTSYYYKPHFGGIENSLFYLSQELINAGYKVILLVSDADSSKRGRLSEEEWVDGMHVFRFKRFLPQISILATVAFFIELKRAQKVAIKISQHAKINFIVSRHYRIIPAVERVFRGKPHFYLIPGVAKYQQLIDHRSAKLPIRSLFFRFYSNHVLLPLKHWFQLRSLKVSTPMVFSQNVMGQLQRAYPSHNFKPIHVYPGVDCTRFSVGTKKNGDIFSFLIVGRLIEQKGISLAIKAMTKLGATKTELVVVGDGPLRHQLINLCKELKVDCQVKFIGFTDHTERYYKYADAFLMTSIHESFGQTILEAFSSGLPVIAFRSKEGVVETANSELVLDKVNGFLCDFSVEDLALKMEQCMKLSERDYLKMSEHNRKEAELKFNWNVLVKTFIQKSK